MTNITLANFPAKSGTLSDAAYIYISEGGQEKKLTVSDLLSKIGSTYSTDINSFLASLTSVAGFDSLSKKGANIASATTTNLDTATGNYINITGTTTITSITLAEGKQRLVRFAGTLILTNGASLVLPSSSNITTSVDDFAIFVGDVGGVVRCVGYFRSSPVATQAEVNAGTNNTNFVTALRLRNGFSMSLTTNGYIAFPSWLGGIIFQWGRNIIAAGVVNTAVALPIAYPTANLLAIGNAISNHVDEQASKAYPTNLSTITLVNGEGVTREIIWFSIGY